MNKKQKMFLSFLESLKTRKTDAIIESVKQAYVLSECGNKPEVYVGEDTDEDFLGECGEDDAMFEGNEDFVEDYNKYGITTRTGKLSDYDAVDPMDPLDADEEEIGADTMMRRGSFDRPTEYDDDDDNRLGGVDEIAHDELCDQRNRDYATMSQDELKDACANFNAEQDIYNKMADKILMGNGY